MWLMIKEIPLDLDNFFETRQQLASEGGIYAQRQLAGIRQLVQESKLEQSKPTTKQDKKADKEEGK